MVAPTTSRTPSTTWGLVSWALFDWANSAYSTVIQTFLFAAYFTRQVAVNETVGTEQWGYTVGVAGLFVALTGPVLGAMADRSGRRKPWLAAFTLLCVGATCLMGLVRPDSGDVFFAMILLALGIIGVEEGAIFYNSMLADLTPRDRIGRWSGWGWGLGYAGGLACLVVALFGIVENPYAGKLLAGVEAGPVRAVFPLVGIWFLVFSLPLFFVTPDRPSRGLSPLQAARQGLRQLSGTLRKVGRYRPLIRFLVARMIYIDGLATVFALGGVYAAGTFDMTERDILMFGIAMNVFAGLGAASFAWLDDRLGSRRTILLSLIGLIVGGVAILVVEAVFWFWVFAFLLGVFVGPVQASSRSYLARLAPESLRSEMFGLYALSGKATAFVGPPLVGWLTALTGSQRIGMGTVVLFFLVGFGLMLGVPKAETTLEPVPVPSSQGGTTG